MDQKTLQAALAGELKSNFSGISLKNVEERLKLHFGQQYGVVFETAPGTGTTVQIKIPAVSVNKEDGIHA
jgi:sensor histidine kinase YesM